MHTSFAGLGVSGPSIKCDPWASSVIFAACCTVACEAGVHCLACFAGWFVISLESSCTDVSEQVFNIWTVAASSFSCPEDVLGDELWLCCSWLEGYTWFALFRWPSYGMKSAEINLHIYTVSGEPVLAVLWFSFFYTLVCCMWVPFKTWDWRCHLKHWVQILATLDNDIYIKKKSSFSMCLHCIQNVPSCLSQWEIQKTAASIGREIKGIA